MSYIGPAPNPGQNREVDDISSSFNGNTTAFTLQVSSQNVSPGSSNNIIVSLGGVVQNPGTDYTIAASTITFTTAPASGLSFFGLVLGQQVDIQSVADSASIVSPTLTGPTVTGDLSIADKIVHTGDTNTAIRFSGADTITAETGGSARLTIASDGKVGIGDPNPDALLHIGTGTNTDGTDVDIIIGGTSINTRQTRIRKKIQSSDRALEIYAATGASDEDIRFFRDGSTENARFTSTGKFYIGTTDGNSMGSKVVIDSSSSDLFAVKFSSEAQSGLAQVIKGFVSGTPSGTCSFIQFQRNDGDVRGSITANTNVGVAFNTTSDYRLKENIVSISDGITRLKTLKPSRFNWKEDTGTTVDGFIAHEVTAVPEAVTGIKDEVDENNKPVYQSIDQSKLVPLLTAALQEAIAKIETLETKVAALEAA